jgi:hypothetical protein
VGLKAGMGQVVGVSMVVSEMQGVGYTRRIACEQGIVGHYGIVL